MMKLFTDETGAFLNWVQLWSVNIWENQGQRGHIAKPLYYASLAGLTEVSENLLEMGADINAQGGEYGNALQAALIKGHGALVKLLMAKGADVDVMALSDAPWASDNDNSLENLADDEDDI